MGHRQQGLQALFGVFVDLLDRYPGIPGFRLPDWVTFSVSFSCWRHCLAALFFQRQGVVGPAFLVVGFEGDPFLAEALFCQALDFGDLVDPALDLLGQLVDCLLRALNRRWVASNACKDDFDIGGLGLDLFEAGLPFFPNTLALDIAQRLAVHKIGDRFPPFRFNRGQLIQTVSSFFNVGAVRSILPLWSSVRLRTAAISPFRSVSRLESWRRPSSISRMVRVYSSSLRRIGFDAVADFVDHARQADFFIHPQFKIALDLGKLFGLFA